MAEHGRSALQASSNDLPLAAVGWLDTHFDACRPEYEAQVRSVGIRPGWRVLDAACGSGSFLPWLADMVGPSGRLDALDLTPENVATARERAEGWRLPCPVEVREGDVLALPYPDNSFDAVWFANTSQYLADDELLRALAEFRRVVRPGGIVAVKDSTIMKVFYQVPPLLFARLDLAVCSTDDAEGRRYRNILYRTAVLRRWLERAGLRGVSQHFTLIERWAPFAPVERQFMFDCLAYYAATGERYGVSAEDQALWARISDPDSPANPGNDPAGYFHEGNVLSVGSVPEGGAS